MKHTSVPRLAAALTFFCLLSSSELNITNCERMEVLRGSGSSLYGSNAIGGVVNLVTDQGGDATLRF